MKFAFLPKTTPDKQQRVYADIWDSDWMKEHQRRLIQRGILNAKIIPIILWSDGTQLTKFSHQQMHPIIASCGSDPLSTRDGNEGKSLVGYIPSLVLSNVAKKHLPAFRLHLFHSCLWALLNDLLVVENTGVWFSVPNGKGGFEAQLFFPLLCCYVGDTPELKKVAGMFSGGNDSSHQSPCWTCSVPGNHLNDINYQSQPGWTLWSKGEFASRKTKMMNLKLAGEKDQMEELSKNFSTHLENNILAEMSSFCIPSDVVTDIDHDLPFGLGLFMVDNFKDVVNHHIGQTSLVEEIANTLADLYFRKLGLPAFLFPRTFVFGMVQGEKTFEKYRLLLWFLPFVLKRFFVDSKGVYGSIGAKIGKCFGLYYKVQKSVYRETFSEKSLVDLGQVLKEFQKQVLEIYGPVSKTNLCTIKFHKIGEIVPQIKRYGRPKNTNTGRYEACHQKFVKRVYLETSKKRQTAPEDMMDKVCTSLQRDLLDQGQRTREQPQSEPKLGSKSISLRGDQITQLPGCSQFFAQLQSFLQGQGVEVSQTQLKGLSMSCFAKAKLPPVPLFRKVISDYKVHSRLLFTTARRNPVVITTKKEHP